jgi:hypothetical protein
MIQNTWTLQMLWLPRLRTRKHFHLDCIQSSGQRILLRLIPLVRKCLPVIQILQHHSYRNYLAGTITISGGGDSYYEYLLKNYLLLGQKDKSLISSWETAVDSMQKYLQQQDDRHPFTYLAELNNGIAYSNSGELVRNNI